MGDKLMMSSKERKRKVALESVSEGRFSLVKAAEVMGVSYRQAKRIWDRFKKGYQHKAGQHNINTEF